MKRSKNTNFKYGFIAALAVVMAFGFLAVPVLNHAHAHGTEVHKSELDSQSDHLDTGQVRSEDHHDGDHHQDMQAQAHEHEDGEAHDHGTATADEPAAHDHSQHASWAQSDATRFLAWLGKFHPALTHFPIALILAAAFAELLFIAGKNEKFRTAAQFCAILGTLSAVVTALVGWFYAGPAFGNDGSVLSAHRWNGTVSAVLAVGVLWAAARDHMPPGRQAFFRVALFTLAIMVSANGYLGGRMVYGDDHLAYPEADHHHDHAEH